MSARVEIILPTCTGKGADGLAPSGHLQILTMEPITRDGHVRLEFDQAPAPIYVKIEDLIRALVILELVYKGESP